MTKSSRSKSRRIQSNVTFGAIAAEVDPLLAAAFYDNGDYWAVTDISDRRCFLIGRTGIGKSAIIRHLEEQMPDRVIRMNPEDLSLSYLANLNLLRNWMDSGVHLEPFFVALWKHVLIVEVIRHKFPMADEAQKQSWLRSMAERFSKDVAKSRAIQYLSEFGERFWADADDRVKEIADAFVKRASLEVDAGANLGVANVGVQASIGREHERKIDETHKQVEKIQKVVNETQIPRLNEMIRIIGNDILRSDQDRVYLVIDDLDKEWVDENLANLLIRCLLQAVSDLISVANLKIIVALRTNIFDHLDFSGRQHGGQEEKFRGLALYLRWTREDLVALVTSRVAAANDHYQILPPLTLEDLLPKGKRMSPLTGEKESAIDYIINRTLLRPRDAILFLNECVRQCTSGTGLTWERLKDVEGTYSRDRLLALRDEWKNPYTGLDRILRSFQSAPAQLTKDDLCRRLDDSITDVLVNEAPSDCDWLNVAAEDVFQNIGGDGAYDPMIRVLIEIGFLGTISKFGHPKAVFYNAFDSHPLATNDAIRAYVIHPAFHRRLGVRNGLFQEA